MSQQNVQFVRALYDAFNRGDLDALENGFSPKFERYEPESSLYAGGNPYRNFTQLREGIYQPRARDFDKWRTEIDQALDAGDFVVTMGRYRARHKTTGKELATQFCHVIHLDGSGRIDALQAYTDTLKEAEVTGRVHRLDKARKPEPAL